MAFDRKTENSPAADAEVARPAPSPAPAVPDVTGQLLQLQATGGNQMVGRLLNSAGATTAPAAAAPDAGGARDGLIAQINGLLAELPGGGVRLTT